MFHVRQFRDIFNPPPPPSPHKKKKKKKEEKKKIKYMSFMVKSCHFNPWTFQFFLGDFWEKYSSALLA